MLLRSVLIISLLLLPLKNFAETAKNKVLSKADQADSSCFLEYSHGAADCNDSAGDDEAAFSVCIKKLKNGLKTCCKTKGGSPKCAADAK